MLKNYSEHNIIGDRYEILQILGGEGKSGVGVVYVCRDLKRARRATSNIALKTLQNRFVEAEGKNKIFRSEALSWMLLDKHPFIVNAYYVVNLEGKTYIAMEYIAPDLKGRNTLTHYLEEPISLQQALIWAIQICYAMEYAASRGLTPHRDIKSDNIMITNDGIAKITDFGLAKFIIENQTVKSIVDLAKYDDLVGKSILKLSLDHSQVVGGTVLYMSPEQFEGVSDMRSDIYSFGIVLYQMTNNGKRPFDYLTIDEFHKAHKYEEPKPLDSKLWPIVKKCIEKKPEDRYQTFTLLRKDLEDLYKEEFKTIPPIIIEKKEMTAQEYFDKGTSFLTLEFYEEAIEEFKHAIYMKSTYYEAFMQLGLIYLKLGRISMAIEEFNKALRLKPHLLEAHLHLAEAYYEARVIENVIAEYKKVIEIDQNKIDAYYFLGNAYDQIQDNEHALENYDTFLKHASPYEYPELLEKAKQARLRVFDKLLKKG